MKSEMKNGIALVVIILLICAALLMPAFFNKIFDSGVDSRMKGIDDGVYHIANSEEKSVQKRMEELSEAIGKKDIKTVSTKIFANDTMCRKIEKEYGKWAEVINENFDIYDTKFDLDSDIIIYDDIKLYWDYDMDISFYVCVGAVGGLHRKEKYEVTMYVDKNTYKILYMKVWNTSIQEKVKNFWKLGKEKKYLIYRINDEQEQKVNAFIKKYYNIPDNKFDSNQTNTIYHANLFDNLQWEVNETSMAGVGFGIQNFDTEYLSNEKVGSVSYAIN